MSNTGNVLVTINNLHELYYNPHGNLYINGEILEGYSEADVRDILVFGSEAITFKEGPAPRIDGKVAENKPYRDFGGGNLDMNPLLKGILIDIFEDFLDEKGIRIPNPERDAEDDEGAANIYGEDYDRLGNDLFDALTAWFTPDANNTEQEDVA